MNASWQDSHVPLLDARAIWPATRPYVIVLNVYNKPPYVQQKQKQNREWLIGLPNKTWVTEFSVLSDTLANKTAPPVLSREIPILQKQNEYHLDKFSPPRDLIGQEHPISLCHCKWS